MLERVSELTTVLLVEQNLGVVARVARDAVVLDTGRVVHTGPAQELLDDKPMSIACSGVRWRRRMSTFVLLTITGLGLGAMYFLIASGLSLIYGLMGVLNFAHGAFLTLGAYALLVHRVEARRRRRSCRAFSSPRVVGARRRRRCSRRSSSSC